MLRIALAQINTAVGDLERNTQKIIHYIKKARQLQADMVVFPELTITGYPPKDLLLKSNFVRENKRKIGDIVKEIIGIAAVIGFVDSDKKGIYNSAAFIYDGKLIGTQNKTHLPNYDVFDEKRYFKSATETNIFELKGIKFGINICEDIWVDNGSTELQVKKGAKFIINISASPFHAGKIKIRRELLSKRARENNIPIVYNNLVGGQDELVFDGKSYVFDSKGNLIAESKHFEEDLLLTTLEGKPIFTKDDITKEIYSALVLGARDYVRKNGFEKIVLGLSGGIDSSLTAAVAVEALGKEKVIGVLMPSAITSKASIEDAKQLAENLGIRYKTISIKDLIDSYSKVLYEEFKGTKPGIAEENIQARIRGNILMALSNKFGYLVLSTGNKSELAVGYCTLYGDMSGGFAVISDVLKTTVYKVAEYVNKINRKEIIPKNVLVKEPSAELKVGQKDRDSLPPYKVLDPILKLYVEEDKSKQEIIAFGFDRKIVEEVINKVDRSEYKRQQAAPGIKITPRAFGTGRRMPITNRYSN